MKSLTDRAKKLFSADSLAGETEMKEEHSNEQPTLRQYAVNSKINGTPQMCILAYFEATFYFSRSEFTCNNNITINYYMQVNSLG